MGENETPNIRYGQLREAVVHYGFSAGRAVAELDWLLDEDRWMEVGSGFKDINDFLKTIDLSDFKFSIEQRKGIAKKLEAIEASQRATAKALGVSQPTIHEDLKNNDRNLSEPIEEAEVIEPLPDYENKIGKEQKTEEKKKEKETKIEDEQKQRAEAIKTKAPIIYHEDCVKFLERFEDKSIDLLFTDPPYSTDIKDLPAFLDTWLYNSLDKIKDAGRAFICIGAYPIEIHTYLEYLLKTDWIIDCPLIWTYRNTLGQTPKMKYNQFLVNIQGKCVFQLGKHQYR